MGTEAGDFAVQVFDDAEVEQAGITFHGPDSLESEGHDALEIDFSKLLANEVDLLAEGLDLVRG